MASEKIPVIDYLWDLLLEEGQQRRIVNQVDVVKAIQHCNAALGLTLSTSNPANFMKDVVRGDNASENWPERLTNLRIGARQRPRSKRVFEFVEFAPDQTEPFPNRYTAHPDLVPTPIESVSLSLAKRRLGRKDESWLIQVAVELRLVQTHFATRSKMSFEEVSHLQTGVKLGTSEIDSLFVAQSRRADGELGQVLLTGEAKQEGQRILEHQLVEQVVAAARSVRAAGLEIEGVVPFALKAIPGGRIYLVEFEFWSLDQTELPEEELPDVKLASEAVYELRPPVPGIGHRNRRPRSASKKASASVKLLVQKSS
jgi:hypothetical protein